MQRWLPRFALLFAASLLLAALAPFATFHAAASPLSAGALTADFALTLTSSGPGHATGGGNFAAGSVATLHPIPDAGAVFVGWTIDGTFDGWSNPRQLTMNAPHVVVALFVARPAFPDVSATDPALDAIGQLAARGIIHGYEDGNFGPADPALRAQMAALIARAIPSNPQSGPGVGPQTWALENHGNTFPDQGAVDADLWRNVGTLAFYDVARGYPDGTYNPTGDVLYVQVISFITRAMVAKGYWQEVTVDDPTLYPNIPASSGHRLDVLTYFNYTDAIPGTTPEANWDSWDQPATRAWFALALWQALDSLY